MKYSRIIFSLLMCCIILLSEAISVTADSGYIFGDVDGNGVVEIADATWLQRHLASIDIPFTINMKTADIDSDGQITLMDATLIQLWLAQLPSNDMIGKRIGPPPMPTQDEYEMPII